MRTRPHARGRHTEAAQQSRLQAAPTAHLRRDDGNGAVSPVSIGTSGQPTAMTRPAGGAARPEGPAVPAVPGAGRPVTRPTALRRALRRPPPRAAPQGPSPSRGRAQKRVPLPDRTPSPRPQADGFLPPPREATEPRKREPRGAGVSQGPGPPGSSHEPRASRLTPNLPVPTCPPAPRTPALSPPPGRTRFRGRAPTTGTASATVTRSGTCPHARPWLLRTPDAPQPLPRLCLRQLAARTRLAPSPGRGVQGGKPRPPSSVSALP